MSDRRSLTRANSPRRSRHSRLSASTRSTTWAVASVPGTPTRTGRRASTTISIALIGAAREHLPPQARILIEPGRSIVASNAITVYRVTTVKRATEPGETTFVAVDGGMGDNLDVALVGQRFEATIADRVGGGQMVTVVGRHCESGDVLM